MNVETVRMNLTGMTPDQRRRIASICTKTLLRTLLPPSPSDSEVADAKAILAMIREIDGD